VVTRGQVVTRGLMVEFTRRIVLLTIACATPAVASAQVPFSAASGPGARGEPSVLTDTAGEIRASMAAGGESGDLSLRVAASSFDALFADAQTRPLTAEANHLRAGMATAVAPSARVQVGGRRRKSIMGWTIAIGIGAGLGAAGAAAAKYGENEGGEFCGRCFLQWSAIAVPVGAGIGAGVGYLIDRSRR
jgi:hypothetical protein